MPIYGWVHEFIVCQRLRVRVLASCDPPSQGPSSFLWNLQCFQEPAAKRNSQTTSRTWTSMGNCRYWSLWVWRTTLCSSDWLLFQIFWTWTLRQNTATCLNNNMKKIFTRYGIPQGVVRDNGSQYADLSLRNLHVNGDSDIQPALPNTHNPDKRIVKKAEADGKDPFEGLL